MQNACNVFDQHWKYHSMNLRVRDIDEQFIDLQFKVLLLRWYYDKAFSFSAFQEKRKQERLCSMLSAQHEFYPLLKIQNSSASGLRSSCCKYLITDYFIEEFVRIIAVNN